MTTKNISASIYLPQYHISKNIKSSNEISMLINISPIETGASLKKIPKYKQGCSGNISENLRKDGKVYRQLSLNSRGTLSRWGSNENISALLGYIRKKRETGKSGRRRRSFTMEAKQSSKRSRRESPCRNGSSHEVTKLDLILAHMPVPNFVNKVNH